MNIKILGGIVVALIIIVGVGYFAVQSEQENVQEAEMDDVMTDEEMEMLNEGEMTSEETASGGEGAASEEAATGSEEVTPQEEASNGVLQGAQAGMYLAYDATAVANSNADKIVLFFHADWCPTCRALDRNITSNLDDIPAGVEIYKVDFDRETALKQQYGITRQHSVLSVGADGEATSSVFHPNSLSQLISGV